MSWDVGLISWDGDTLGEWNYTHNTWPMVTEALKRADHNLVEMRWWDELAGMSGPTGAKFLHTIITQLEQDPMTFEAMNPINGWGSYITLLDVLKEMRSAVPERPCYWEGNG